MNADCYSNHHHHRDEYADRDHHTNGDRVEYAHAYFEPHGNSNRIVNADCYSNHHPHRDEYAYCDHHTNGDRVENAHPYSDRDSNPSSYSFAYPYFEPHHNSNHHLHRDANRHLDSRENVEAHANGDAHSDRNQDRDGNRNFPYVTDGDADWRKPNDLLCGAGRKRFEHGIVARVSVADDSACSRHSATGRCSGRGRG